MKKIKIECCGECPYLMLVRPLLIGAEFSERCEMSGNYIEDVNEIDENCPLPDDN